MAKDIIIGIDAGTSILKVVAFTLNGKEIASSSKKIYTKLLMVVRLLNLLILHGRIV